MDVIDVLSLMLIIKAGMLLAATSLNIQAQNAYHCHDHARGDRLLNRSAWLTWLPLPPPSRRRNR